MKFSRKKNVKFCKISIQRDFLMVRINIKNRSSNSKILTAEAPLAYTFLHRFMVPRIISSHTHPDRYGWKMNKKKQLRRWEKENDKH